MGRGREGGWSGGGKGLEGWGLLRGREGVGGRGTSEGVVCPKKKAEGRVLADAVGRDFLLFFYPSFLLFIAVIKKHFNIYYDLDK